MSTFIAGLPGLAVHALRGSRKRELLALAREVAGVRFVPPDGFAELDFHFLGGTGPWPLPDAADRLLVVSPFITDDAAQRLLGLAPRVSVLSRAEELDRLPAATLGRFEKRLVLSPAAVPSSELTDEDDAQRPLVGLHAKLYVVELGSRATWFCGSANATAAAFGGNVEVLVELRGARRAIGVDQLLGDSESGLARLLQEHPLPLSQAEETAEEELQRSVDDLRRAIAAIPFVVSVAAAGDAYKLTVTSDPLPTLAQGSATIIVRPLSLPTGSRIEPGEPVDITFGPVSLDSVTPFIVVEVVARRGGTVVQDAFVLRAELVNEPRDRADRLLASLLASRKDVLRYLLFLLADTGGATPSGWFGDLQRAIERGESSTANDGPLELPLLETLVRTVARDPAKLASVQRLVDALSKTEDGKALLPDGFSDIWPVIWQATKPAEVQQ